MSTSRSRWGLIALLGVASGLSAFGMASVVPTLPTLSRALGADFGSLQFVVSAYLLGLGLFQPIQGLLCDRFGRRPVMLMGFSLFAAASLLASVASGLASLVLARFLQAMGVSVATVVSRAIVRDTFEPGPAAIALSFITAVMGVAPVIAPVIGGTVVEVWGWRGVFWVHASVSLLVCAVMWRRLPETRPADTEAMTVQQLIGGGRVLVRDARFMGPVLTYSFLSASGMVFITIGAALYERLFTMNGAQFGFLWSGLAVSYVIGATTAGQLARRLGSRRAQRVGMGCNLLAISGFVVAALLPTPWIALFSGSLALLMFANGAVSPLVLMQAVDDHPSLAGVAAGLSSAIAMLVSMLSAVLTGVLYEGSALPCALLMALSGVGALWALRLGERGHWRRRTALT